MQSCGGHHLRHYLWHTSHAGRSERMRVPCGVCPKSVPRQNLSHSWEFERSSLLVQFQGVFVTLHICVGGDDRHCNNELACKLNRQTYCTPQPGIKTCMSKAPRPLAHRSYGAGTSSETEPEAGHMYPNKPRPQSNATAGRDAARSHKRLSARLTRISHANVTQLFP